MVRIKPQCKQNILFHSFSKSKQQMINNENIPAVIFRYYKQVQTRQSGKMHQSDWML